MSVEDPPSGSGSFDIANIRQLQTSEMRGLESTTEQAEANQRCLDAQNRRELRNAVQSKLVWTLWGELIFLAVLMLLQGFKPLDFELNQWVFGIFSTSVLAQTFLMIRIIVKSLFPNGDIAVHGK